MGLKFAIVWNAVSRTERCDGPLLATHPQDVLHQRSPSRSELYKLYALALSALRQPFCHEPYAHELAKDLRDLRRGDEVPSLAKLVLSIGGAARIVSSQIRDQALAHVLGDGDWSSGLQGMLDGEGESSRMSRSYSNGFSQRLCQWRRPLSRARRRRPCDQPLAR